MGCDELKLGVRIKKFVIFAAKITKICYRSVCNHPFAVGILLFFLCLYRSSPFLFSLLVSASPVLVCTAVLLGTLLSFGDPNIVSSIEEEEKSSQEISTSRVENTIVVDDHEFMGGKNSKITELRREIVKIIDEEPLLDKGDKLDNLQNDHCDIAFNLMPNDHMSREVGVEKRWIDEGKREVENIEIEDTEFEHTVGLDDQLIRTREGVDLSDMEALQTRVSAVKRVQAEHFEDYKSAEGSADAQMSELLVSLESWKRLDGVLADSLASCQDVQHENFEDYKSAEGSVDDQVLDQLEPSLASWKQFDEHDDRLSPAQDVQVERFEDYQLAEESSEAQMRDHLESSLRSWQHFGSDHDEDDESDSESDGAESSSPDASMADIIPMLDELDPLLEDEIPLASDLSYQNSAAKSPGSNIHSDDESDHKEEEGDDCKSEADEDNEDETQEGKEDPEKSAIMWTEDDQKNLMDLGTSELERNQRLESLIARRRARKMANDRNFMDLDGMDLPFPVAPISTRKQNPFDFPHDSYDDLGLPPIPGSAPSIMLSRRNPFDLPYDSSEEKPDLTGDSFQQEFTELTQREAYNQRETLFRRNETFNLGSSAFDFGRPSRFRPYFIPERTDSDVMSYASLQRQLSELSESKASSAGETESTSVGLDQEEKKLTVHDSAQDVEPSSEIDNASLLVEHGSPLSDDLNLLSGDDVEKDFVHSVPGVELGGASSHNEDCHNAQFTSKLIEVKHNVSSSVLSLPKELHEVEDVSKSLVNGEQSQVNDVLNVEVPVKYSLEPSVSDITPATEVDNDYSKEPIFDFSPLKKDQSLSSSSSDLQTEASGIDIYHLSRDLFVVEETYVHNRDVENMSRNTQQDTYENGLTMNANDIAEDSGVRSTEFSELNQLLCSSQASVVVEDEGHLSIDSLERRFEDQLSDEKLSPGEVAQGSAPGDSCEIYPEDRLDDDCSSDDTISSGGLEFLEESVLMKEKIEVDILANNASPRHSTVSCSTVDSKEDIDTEMEVNHQFQVSSLESHEDDEIGLDKNCFLPQGSNIVDNSADPLEQESSIVHRELEEIGQLNKVDEPVNALKILEPQHDSLSDSLQTTVSSSQPKESVTKPVVELPVEDHAQEICETRYAYISEENNKISEDLEGSIGDESFTYTEKSDVNEMDETLLSELDAVGDFSLPNIVPNLKNIDIPAGVSVEAYSTIEPYTGANLSETKESNLDSPAGDVSSDVLAFKAQSVADTDAACNRVSEEVQNSVASDFHVEFTEKEVEVSIPERESMLEVTERERCALEDTEPESIQTDLDLLKGKILDTNKEETDSGMLVRDVVINERSVEDVEEVTEEDNISDIVEALQTVPETGISNVEFIPLINRENKDMEESPLVEESASLPLEHRNELESVSSIEFDSSRLDGDNKRKQESLLLDAGNTLALESEYVEETFTMPVHGAGIEHVAESENQTEKNASEPQPLDEEIEVIPESASKSEDHQREIVESSDPLELDINNREVQESPTSKANLSSAFDVEETKVTQTFESMSLELDEESGTIQDCPLFGTSSASSLDFEQEDKVVGNSESEPSHMHIESEKIQDPNAVQASIPTSRESEEEKEMVGSVESKLLLLGEESEKIQHSPLVGASIASSLEFEEEKKLVESLEFERLPKDSVVEDLREWHVVEESNSIAVVSEDQIERTNPIKSHPLQDAELKKIQNYPSVSASIASPPKFEDQIMTFISGETGPVMIESNTGKLPELTGARERMTHAVESEGQLERFYSVGFEFLQMLEDSKEIQESPVSHTICTSAVESKDQTEINSQMENHQLVSQEQSEVDVPKAESEIHNDSSTIVAESSNNKVDQGTSKSASEKLSSQLEEKSHESHLVFSSSSSSSSSSGSDEN